VAVGGQALGRKINAFYDIVIDLVARHPSKVHFFQYNTGGIGEMIEVDKVTGKKKLIRKVTRVPIDLMAALQRGDLRGTNEYSKGRLGTEFVVRCEGGDRSAYNPATRIDTGELESLTLLRLWEGKPPPFCTADGMAVVGLCLLGFSHLAISLESLLTRFGLGRKLSWRFSEGALKQ
jgi:hypothetical protein